MLNAFLDKTHYGVQLFYIVSALTIFLSYSKRKNNEISPNRNFFIRRFFRIAPMFYLAILFYSLSGNIWLTAFPGSEGSLLSHIFFLHGFNPYWINADVPGGWSIAVEMIFYLSIPVLFYLVKNLNHAVIFFLMSLALQYFLNLYFTHHPLIEDDFLWKKYLDFNLLNQLPVFALGIILFQLLNSEHNTKTIKPVIILLIFIIFFTHFWIKVDLIPDFMFISISFVFLAFYSTKSSNILLVNPLIGIIGKVSYSMYLIHFAILDFMLKINLADIIDNSNHHTINLMLRFSIALSVTFAISWILYNIIEKPMQKSGGKLITYLENRSYHLNL